MKIALCLGWRRCWNCTRQVVVLISKEQVEGEDPEDLDPEDAPYAYDDGEWPVPDWASDLNAMREAAVTITDKVKQAQFSETMIQILNRKFDGEHRFIGSTPFHLATAEASELADAFLATMLP